MVHYETRVIDLDVKTYFDIVRHDLLLRKVAERAKEVTRNVAYPNLVYCRFADDLVVLVDGYLKWDWLLRAVHYRLLEELPKLGVEVNAEKTSDI